MAEPLAASLIRLVSGGRILGTGVVLPRGLVATCAHVIEGADEVIAEFPLLSAESSAVEILERDDEADFAFLRLISPPPEIRPAPVRLDSGLHGHRFRAIGFTHTEPHGVWVTGDLLGQQGEGRFQMAVEPSHKQVVAGFSGAPVWDDQLRGVVGVIVAASDERTAHLIPISILLPARMPGARAETGRNPYLGLKPFQSADADYFHGRDEEITELLELLEHQDMVAIAGPSGSGKSSLVRAGLLPRMEAAGATIVESLDAKTPDGSVLFLDQFEEIAIADPSAARQRLAEVIRLVAEKPRRLGEPASLRVVLTLRSQSLDDLITPENRRKLNQAVWLLEPMDRARFREVITQPAIRAGNLSFENGLVDRILGDAAPDHGTLPLLSKVLEQLWDRRIGDQLTHDAYDSIGQLSGALRKQANDALTKIRPSGTDLARRLLSQLTRPDGEGNFVRQTARLADFPPELQEIAAELAASQLLVIRNGQVALVHQVLIDSWPTLRDWLTEDEKFLAWQAKLRNLRDSGGQLRDTALAEAVEWLTTREHDIPAHLRDFIRRSITAQRRTQRRWRTITAISGSLTLVAALLVGVVLVNNAELNQRIREINATALAEMANRDTANPSEALQFALAGWREAPDSIEAQGALLQQRLYWRGVGRTLTEPPLHGVAEMLSTADAGVVVFVPQKPSDPAVVWQGLLGGNAVHREIPMALNARFALSPDGRLLARYDDVQGLLLWDLSRSGDPVMLHGPWNSQVDQMSFSANNAYLAFKPYDAPDYAGPPPILLWDLRALPAIPPPGQYPHLGNAVIQDMYPLPDGRSYVTVEDAGSGSESPAKNVEVARDLVTGSELHRSAPVGSLDVKLLDNGTRAISCLGATMAVSDSLTGAITYTRNADVTSGECNLPLLDASGQYLYGMGNTNGKAVHWKTGTELNYHGPDVLEGLSSDSTDALLVASPDRSLTTVTVHNGAVQVSPIPTFTGPADVPETRQDLRDRSPDGKFWVAYEYGPSGERGDAGNLALLDSRGAVLNRTRAPVFPYTVAFDATGERVLVVADKKLQVYRRDGLVPERTMDLPIPAGRTAGDRVNYSNAAIKTMPDGTVVVSHLGMLSSWDVRTGTQVRPPLTIDPPVDWRTLPGGPAIALRPGHPDHVLALTGTGPALWDLRSGSLVRQYNVEASSLTMSSDGTIAALDTATDGTTSMINLDTGEFLPQLHANSSYLVGISGDLLFVMTNANLEVWNWKMNRRIATADLTGTGTPAVDGNAYLPDFSPGSTERIELDPEVWFHDLCRISDREFTTQELRQLPEGVSHDRPCR